MEGRVIKKNANISEKDDFNSIVNKLGNRILLEEKINKGLREDWFETKKQKYQESKYPIAKKLSASDKKRWTKKDIEDATKEAINRILNFIFDNK